MRYLAWIRAYLANSRIDRAQVHCKHPVYIALGKKISWFWSLTRLDFWRQQPLLASIFGGFKTIKANTNIEEKTQKWK